MAAKRMTANDYRIELKRVNDLQMSVKNNITKRLLELCKQYPDVEVENGVKSKYYVDVQQFINEMFSTNRQIDFIQTIEQWIANQHPHKQTRMF